MNIKLATALVFRFLAMRETERRIDKQVATAYFRGMCDAAYNMGYGRTPDHVWLVTQDTVTAAGPRPPFHSASKAQNAPMHEWDRTTALAVMTALNGDDPR